VSSDPGKAEVSSFIPFRTQQKVFTNTFELNTTTVCLMCSNSQKQEAIHGSSPIQVFCFSSSSSIFQEVDESQQRLKFKEIQNLDL
jgi:hypothetical protein